MLLTKEQAHELMYKNGGNLDLSFTEYTALQDGLYVPGNLYLSFSKIEQLPNRLTVGKSLTVSSSRITEIPDDTVIGGDLNMACSKIAKLPNHFVIGGSLDACHSSLRELPFSLSIGGDLLIAHTGIQNLAFGLFVGGKIDTFHTSISSDELKRVGKLYQGASREGRYLYADGKITHINNVELMDGKMYFNGKIPNCNVISDGKQYVPCSSLDEGRVALCLKAVSA